MLSDVINMIYGNVWNPVTDKVTRLGYGDVTVNKTS